MKTNVLFIFSLIVITNLFDTIRELFLKSAINSLKRLSPVDIKTLIRFIVQLLLTSRIWLSFSFALLSLCLWLFVLSKADLNFAFSLDSMHYIFIAFASRLFLKEKVGLKRWMGTIFVVIGIILVTLS